MLLIEGGGGGRNVESQTVYYSTMCWELWNLSHWKVYSGIFYLLFPDWFVLLESRNLDQPYLLLCDVFLIARHADVDEVAGLDTVCGAK